MVHAIGILDVSKREISQARKGHIIGQTNYYVVDNDAVLVLVQYRSFVGGRLLVRMRVNSLARFGVLIGRRGSQEFVVLGKRNESFDLKALFVPVCC